jgi:hypothetical protein
MKRVLLTLCAGSVLMLSACADDSGFYRPHYAGATGFDAYYDDFYGPFYDGYWAPGDAFYYRTGPHGFYHRDRGMHFHHGPGTGMHAVHGMPHGTPGGGRGRHP